MRSLAEQLLEYFNNTPQGVLDKDWEEIHRQYAYGIEAQDFINAYNSYQSTSKELATTVQTLQNITEEFSFTGDYAVAA